MGGYTLRIGKKATKDLQELYKSGRKSDIKKVETFFKELKEHPYTGTGQPEQLKHELSNFWSRRINQKNRLIYSVSENTVTVEVVSAMGHYSDK